MTGGGARHGLGANASGIVAMLGACALFVLGDSCIKLIGRDLPLGQMIFMRGLFSFPIVLAIAARSGVLARLPEVAGRPALQWRTALEVGSTIFFLAAIVRMSYADAIAIQQFLPLAVIAGAAVFLGEEVGWRRWLAALAGLVGVLIVLRPGTGAMQWAALLVIANVVCVAGRDLITRRLGADVPTLLVACLSIGCVGLSGLLLLPFEVWRAPSPTETLLLAVSGISSIGGFYWITAALRRGEVAVVMPFRYVLIPYSVLSSIVVFGDWPDAASLTGSTIVLAAGLYAFHRERVRMGEQRAAEAAITTGR